MRFSNRSPDVSNGLVRPFRCEESAVLTVAACEPLTHPQRKAGLQWTSRNASISHRHGGCGEVFKIEYQH
ncbi:MAG: hypothetical protein ACYTFQ_28955, partial [Planctomycetota bacterium]